jgi:hypothetical protein
MPGVPGALVVAHLGCFLHEILLRSKYEVYMPVGESFVAMNSQPERSKAWSSSEPQLMYSQTSFAICSPSSMIPTFVPAGYKAVKSKKVTRGYRLGINSPL